MELPCGEGLEIAAEVLLCGRTRPRGGATVRDLVRKEKNPLDRIGLAAAGDNSVHASSVCRPR